MITNSTIKRYSKLRQKKYRDKYGLFTVDGYTRCVEAINSKFSVVTILTTYHFVESDSRFSELRVICKSYGVPIEVISEAKFDIISETKTPQGVMGVLKISDKVYCIPETGIIIALDSVRDPGNVGAVIRSAHWFGAKQVVLGKNSAGIYNPKTVRSAAGSSFYLPIFQDVNLLGLIPHLKKRGYTIYTAEMEGELLTRNFKSAEKSVLIMGSESHGVSREVSALADRLITIPRVSKMESLNIAVATGIILDRFTNHK